jgi:A circularly permuted ATPgrasp
MPDIVKFYLGEEPLLKNVATWRCRESEHLNYVLDNIEELVHGSGGYGMLIGPKADKAAISTFRQAQIRPKEFHRATNAGAFNLPDLRRGRYRAAPCRFAPNCALRPRSHPHRARRADAGGTEEGFTRRQFEPGRRH